MLIGECCVSCGVVRGMRNEGCARWFPQSAQCELRGVMWVCVLRGFARAMCEALFAMRGVQCVCDARCALCDDARVWSGCRWGWAWGRLFVNSVFSWTIGVTYAIYAARALQHRGSNSEWCILAHWWLAVWVASGLVRQRSSHLSANCEQDRFERNHTCVTSNVRTQPDFAHWTCDLFFS